MEYIWIAKAIQVVPCPLAKAVWSTRRVNNVSTFDNMTMVLWTKLFLEAQGIEVVDNIIYQDNKSTMLLERMVDNPVARKLNISRFDTTSFTIISSVVMSGLSIVPRIWWLVIFILNHYKAALFVVFELSSWTSLTTHFLIPWLIARSELEQVRRRLSVHPLWRTWQTYLKISLSHRIKIGSQWHSKIEIRNPPRRSLFCRGK